MLDIQVLTPPTVDGLDVVSLAEMRSHMRISPTNTRLDTEITSAVQDVVDALSGPGGVLNRTILQTEYELFLHGFPGRVGGASLPILLPYSPASIVSGLSINSGSSPIVVDDTTYTVRTDTLVGEVISNGVWPSMVTGARALSVVYTAGYPPGQYPRKLKRLVKILAAHWMENTEATINEPRQMMINRAVEFGYQQLIDQMRIPLSYDDWNY